MLLWQQGTTANTHRYCGEELDQALGLYNLRARLMNPLTSRFWSADSYEGSNDDLKSLHRYLYANADPIGSIDPSGHESLGELSVTQSNIGTTIQLAIYRVAPAATLVGEIILGSAGGGGPSSAAGEIVGQDLSFILSKINNDVVALLRVWLRLGTGEVGLYKNLSRFLRATGMQANHLNQDAAFRRIIASEDGISNALQGGVNVAGTEHNLFHKALEAFWEQFRTLKGIPGPRFGQTPTIGEYSEALRRALEATGRYSDEEVQALLNISRANRAQFGLTDAMNVPDIPGRTYPAN